MKKIPIWKNAVLIISLVVVILIATFAWFVVGPYARINGLSLDVGEASYIQISGDEGGSWSEDLSFNVGINNKFKELSGNGVTLFAPVYDIVEAGTGELHPAIVAFEEQKDDAKYFEQIFTFRADADYNVYLAPESYVKAASEGQNSYIDGAIRVAFFELDENDNETLKCIWAPNSTVAYSADTHSFTRDGAVEAYYYYQKSATPVDMDSLTEEANPHVVKIPTADPENPDISPVCGYDETYQFMWSCDEDLPDNAPALLSLNRAEGETLANKRLKVKVWLEGYDRECVSLLSGQKFTMKFQFNADKGE